MVAKFCKQNIYKSLLKCGIHFVYILYTKVYWNVGYILYTFCIQKFVEMWDTFCIQTLCQAFIQAVLLMSIFWTKIEFSNDVKCRLGSWGGVSSITSSWWSPARGSGSEKIWKKFPWKFFWPFCIWRTNK